MKKTIVGVLLVVTLTGCRYWGDPKSEPTFLQDPIPIVPIPMILVTNNIPSPPGLAAQKIVTKRSVRALAVTPFAPDKFVVVRWDNNPDTNISYRVTWTSTKEGKFTGAMNTTQTKLDLVTLFKQQGVPRGWYRVDVQAVNELYVSSEPVSAPFFWYPSIDPN